MKYSADKDINKIVSDLVRNEGWTFSHGKKHGKLKKTDGGVLIVPTSPSCPRAYENFCRDLRKQCS